jgi:hypothetical protein
MTARADAERCTSDASRPVAGRVRASGIVPRAGIAAAPVLAACGGAGSPAAAPPPPAAPFAVSGTVTFGARLPTTTGASSETMRPAPFTVVAVLDATGAELQKGTTDVDG